jgi:hypothetical protein
MRISSFKRILRSSTSTSSITGTTVVVPSWRTAGIRSTVRPMGTRSTRTRSPVRGTLTSSSCSLTCLVTQTRPTSITWFESGVKSRVAGTTTRSPGAM